MLADARDAAARLANYEAMVDPLIDAGVLGSLVQFIPTVKPLNRLPPTHWGPDALREINNTLQALDLLIFIYGKADREADLPVDHLASSHLTSWICDVLHGKEEGEV
jgi:hypothetical protein